MRIFLTNYNFNVSTFVLSICIVLLINIEPIILQSSFTWE